MMIRVLALTLLLLTSSLCAQQGVVPESAAAPTPAVAKQRLKVVVANPIVADLVRTVGGSDIDLTVLAGAAGDPHHYEPTPADARAVASADLVLPFGLGLDRSVATMHATGGSSGALVCVAEGLGSVECATESGHEHGDGHDAHDGGHASHGHVYAVPARSIDPHIWHDPSKVQRLNERICAALCTARPELAQAFRRRSGELDAELVQLDSWIAEQVKKIAQEKRVLVTTHDGLRYFANRYGFRVVGIEGMAGGVSQSEPAPKDLIAMVRELEGAQCTVVFGDRAHPSRVAAAVAREAKVKLVETLSLDGLLPNEATKAPTSYLATMRANVTIIVEALSE